MNAWHFPKVAGAWTAMAAALALLASPAQARPENWEGNHRGAQAQSGGNWNGGEGGQRGGWRGGGNGGSGARQSGSGDAGQGSQGGQSGWGRGHRGGSSDNANGGGWRVRQQAQGAQQSQSGQPVQSSDQAWRGRGGASDGQDRSARREAWRARQQAQGQPPVVAQDVDATRWQHRNRTYSDPDRGRAHRETWRDGQRDGAQDSWRGETRREQRLGYRQGQRDPRTDAWRSESWRNDGRHGDSWRNDGNRHGNWRDGRRYTHGRDARAWNRDWRRDRRYDWQSYRNSNRHIYRPGRYYAPYSGYYYRPLSIGFMLDSMFYSSRYWIDDPWQYRLPEVYGPYRWIRYYDDALLVDIYTGEVVDVIQDFFW